MWAAFGARIRLCMKPPVEGIVIFPFTFRTLLESPHRRVRTVVRQFFDNAESRTAVRAVRERIPIPPVCWIKYFAQAIRTNRDIRKNQGGLLPTLFAITNFEPFITLRIEKGAF